MTSIVIAKSAQNYYRDTGKILVVLALVFSVLGLDQGTRNKSVKFIVYYGNFFPQECEKEYDVFILSPNTQGNITELADKHLVAGYLSLGEVDSSQSYFRTISQKDFVLHKNPLWPDARLVDVRDIAWHRFILEELIPNLTNKGFNGLFLDTMDSALALERKYPERYQGSTEGLISLIKKIKQNYPGLRLISNNAFSILPQIDGFLEYVLAESLFTSYDFSGRKYQLTTDDHRLKLANNIFSQLTSKPLVLEYAVDSQIISEVRIRNNAYNFSLFFSNIHLTKGCP